MQLWIRMSHTHTHSNTHKKEWKLKSQKSHSFVDIQWDCWSSFIIWMSVWLLNRYCIYIHTYVQYMYRINNKNTSHIYFLMHTHKVECRKMYFGYFSSFFNKKNETTKWSHTFQLLFQSLEVYTISHIIVCIYIYKIYLFVWSFAWFVALPVRCIFFSFQLHTTLLQSRRES